MKKHLNLPRFIVYQPDPKVFHICLEVGAHYYVWWSHYPPTQDNRHARKVKRLKAIVPTKIPTKQIYDEGTYTINKGDDKAAVEKKMKSGVKDKSFSFILEGALLKGRFIVKQTSAGTMLQKFKDKFATEEDIFSGDLSRTISLMVPDYDPSKVKLNYPGKARARVEPKQVKSPVPEDEEMQVPEPEPITADKKLGNRHFHFDFYRSKTGPDIYIVSSSKDGVSIIQKDGRKWQLLKSARGTMLREAKALEEHAAALYEQVEE